MSKNFDEWNILKKDLETSLELPFFRSREIWWCHLGVNLGYEEDGKGKNFSRPVLILNSYNRHLFLGVALSSKIKPDNFYYKEIEYNKRTYSVIISQIRLLDAKRLIRKITVLDKQQFQDVKNNIKGII